MRVCVYVCARALTCMTICLAAFARDLQVHMLVANRDFVANYNLKRGSFEVHLKLFFIHVALNFLTFHF